MKQAIKVLTPLSIGLFLALYMVGVTSLVSGQLPFGSALVSVAVDNTNTGITAGLTLDKDNYNQGETIQIWGTASGPENTPLENGTATIQLSCGSWNQQRTTPIAKGVFNYNYPISHGNPNGTWNVTVTANDNLGNSGSASENILVGIPPNVYYTVQFSNPIANLSYRRGENVRISVDVSQGGVAVQDAEVSLNSPKGENVVLNEIAPGTYSAVHTLGWDDPSGVWCISAEAKKTTENRAGGSWIPIQIEPATLEVNLLSPTQRTFNVEDSVELKVQVFYPDGQAVENLTIVVASPRGENLNLMAEGSGVYSTTYTFGSGDVGSWSFKVTAADRSGNSGFQTGIIDIVRPGVIGAVAKYWWAILSAIVAVGVASAYVAKRMRAAIRLDRIKRELKELDKFEKEAIVRYFKDGSISRSTFDRLMGKFERRRSELTKKERLLEPKVKKKTGKS